MLRRDRLPIIPKTKSIPNTMKYEPVFVRIMPETVATKEVGISVRLVMLKLSA